MSSDNGLLLMRTDLGWELREYCASVDSDWDCLRPVGAYEIAEAALRASRQFYTEYGVTFVDSAA